MGGAIKFKSENDGNDVQMIIVELKNLLQVNTDGVTITKLLFKRVDKQIIRKNFLLIYHAQRGIL
ncbi:hypothetical protein BIV60_26165 [Bacillus sp. MUM 116]|nr:hypothetical protein BIV60_26165 [Bacillus sp. MUM 116]